MELNVPDDIVQRAETNAIELRIALAVQLYADNRLDYADACRLADMPSIAFNRELFSRSVCVQQYPPRPALRNAG